MTGLVRAEILRWRRRPEVIATIVAVIVIATINWWTGLSSAQSLLRDMTGPADAQSQSAAFFLAPYRFPASIVWILSTGLWLNYGMLYLAVATTGGEYAWATIRNVLLSVTRRSDYLVGRIAFLLGLGFLLVLAEAVIGAILPALLSVESNQLAPAQAFDATVGMAAFMAAFLGVIFYATLGVFLATLFRDRAAPLLVAAAIILAQTTLSSLPFWSASDLLQWIPRLFPGNALGALRIATQREVGLIAPEAVLPGYLNGPWPFSLAVCIVWICALVMGTVLLLGRSDVTE